MAQYRVGAMLFSLLIMRLPSFLLLFHGVGDVGFDVDGGESFDVGPVIEKYKLPPIQIFDKNCPLKRVNQKFFDKMYVNWNFFGNISQKIHAY